MDGFNQIIKVVNDVIPIVQSGIPSIVGGFITAMFLRGNTQRVEFEKIKMGKIQEAVDDLVKNHELTLTELVKCRNLIKIAELADKEYKSKGFKHEKNTEHEFDFDWFLRFFEGAGNISNEDMQLIWARILSGEVQQQGTFSLRTLESLRNMTQSEAMLVQQISKVILTLAGGEKFIYCDSYTGNFVSYDKNVSEINEKYGLNDNDYSVLIDSGILNPVKRQYNVGFFDGTSYMHNGNIALIFASEPKQYQNTKESIDFYCFPITKVGTQIISVIDVQPNDNYILDVGLLLKKKYPNFDISAYGIIAIDGDNLVIDDNLRWNK